MLPCQSFARIDPETVAGAWLFDEEADVVEDVSGNGNNGIVNGDPEWDDGKFGGAISYDGMNDFVDCGAGESLSVGTDNFSLVAWIRAAVINFYCSTRGRQAIIRITGGTIEH